MSLLPPATDALPMPLTPLPSPERAQRQGKEEIFTEHNLGTPFNTVTDGTDTGMVGLTQEGSTAPISLLNLTHATIPSFKQAKESTLKTNADPTDVIVPVPALQKQATDSLHRCDRRGNRGPGWPLSDR